MKKLDTLLKGQYNWLNGVGRKPYVLLTVIASRRVLHQLFECAALDVLHIRRLLKQIH